MIQRKPQGNNPKEYHTFIITVEAEQGDVTEEQMMNAISDALTPIEGIGYVDVEHLGRLSVGAEDK